MLIGFLGAAGVIAAGGIEIFLRQPISFQKHYGPKVDAIRDAARAALGNGIDRICAERRRLHPGQRTVGEHAESDGRLVAVPHMFPEAVDDMKYLRTEGIESLLGQLSTCSTWVVVGTGAARRIGVGLVVFAILLVASGVIILSAGDQVQPYTLLSLLLPGYGVYYVGSNLKEYQDVAAGIEVGFNALDASARPDW